MTARGRIGGVALSIRIEEGDDVVILRLAGDLALESADRLRAEAGAFRDDERPLVIEASRLAFMDSTGISELVALAASRGRPVGVLNPQPVVRNVLTLLDLAVVLPQIERIDAGALARLSTPLGARDRDLGRG